MGNSAPSADRDENGDGDDYAEQFDGIETLGYRVLGVQPNSPGTRTLRNLFFVVINDASTTHAEIYACWLCDTTHLSMHFCFSTASQAGLVSFFDFIVGANEQMLLGSGEGLEDGEEYDDVDFPGLLRENIGKPVQLCKPAL
jgi:hypothetical protein